MKKQTFPANKFDQFLIDSIKGYEKTLVYVDGEDVRTAYAVKEFVKYNSSKIILLGREDIIAKNVAQLNFKSENLEIIEPLKSDKLNEYLELLIRRFKERGKEITDEQALEITGKPNYFAALMLKAGDAHGGISGSISSTEAMIRPLIQVIGVGTPKRYLSGAVIQIIPDCPFSHKGHFLFADTAVIPEPDLKQMLDTVLLSYQTAKAIFDDTPKIAMLSYSTKGSASSPKIDQIKRVIGEVRKINPDIKIDGELQFDAAIIPEVAKAKGVKSEVAGQANVLIFPNLAATNICIKAVHWLAEAYYYGSIIQGAPIPFNDLSRGCTPVEILTLSAITLMQLKEMEREI